MIISFARVFLFKQRMKLPKIQLPKKPVYIKFAEDIDFFALFQKIEQQCDTCFLFESLGEEGNFSRYAIIGFDPQQIISARDNILTIDNKKYDVGNPYFALQEIMPEKTIARNYAGGLVGYISYEAANYFEPSIKVKIHKDFDQFLFGVYTDGLILDKLTNELFYFYYERDRSNLIKKIMKSKISKTSLQVTFLNESITKKEHANIVKTVKEQIDAGNTFQCEVGFKSKYTIAGNTIKIYERLRKMNPSPFMYYVTFNRSTGSRSSKRIIGASPELSFSLRDGEMTVRPLAGTVKRGIDQIEDQKLSRILLNDAKEIAEHNMLVDLQRNDIGKVAKFGTVKIRDFMSIKKFSHVQHISSEITGLLKDNENMFTGFAANFPMGTLTGAPKIESMKIIDTNEPEARGPYGGAVGHFGFNGDCTFAVAIRSLFVSGNNAYTQTSGGIVYDSIAEKEYEEIQRKLAAMKKVLNANI